MSTTQTTLTKATPRKNDGSDLTDDELEVYKTMELEFYAEFLKNDPMCERVHESESGPRDISRPDPVVAVSCILC